MIFKRQSKVKKISTHGSSKGLLFFGFAGLVVAYLLKSAAGHRPQIPEASASLEPVAHYKPDEHLRTQQEKDIFAYRGVRCAP